MLYIVIQYLQFEVQVSQTRKSNRVICILQYCLLAVPLDFPMNCQASDGLQFYYNATTASTGL